MDPLTGTKTLHSRLFDQSEVFDKVYILYVQGTEVLRFGTRVLEIRFGGCVDYNFVFVDSEAEEAVDEDWVVTHENWERGIGYSLHLVHFLNQCFVRLNFGNFRADYIFDRICIFWENPFGFTLVAVFE